MKTSRVTSILAKVARRMGVQIHIEPRYGFAGQICLPNGQKRYFRGAHFDMNGLGASEIAQDKDFAAHFLKLMGYPVPRGQAFFTRRWCEAIGSRRTPEAAYRYARSLGFPVIVKPNSKSQGSGVCRVWNKREFLWAVRNLEHNERVFLVQRVVEGNDYRIVVLDREIVSAYRRTPLSTTGDGRSTVAGLLRRKQTEFVRRGRDTVIRMDDARITLELRRQGLARNSVLDRGRKVFLLASANLSTGGDVTDVTDALHPAWKKLARQIARDMNLRYIGVDVIVRGTLAEPPGQYVVLEVNAAPGLDNYASIGSKQRRIVEDLYARVLTAMLR